VNSAGTPRRRPLDEKEKVLKCGDLWSDVRTRSAQSRRHEHGKRVEETQMVPKSLKSQHDYKDTYPGPGFFWCLYSRVGAQRSVLSARSRAVDVIAEIKHEAKF
jgi:hypothetical protein